MEIVTFIALAMPSALGRAGVAEVRADEDVAIRLEPGVLALVVRQLAVRGLRALLRGGLVVVDVYPEELPFQRSLSIGQPQLRDGDVRGHSLFS